jgi:hypothetical protein
MPGSSVAVGIDEGGRTATLQVQLGAAIPIGARVNAVAVLIALTKRPLYRKST